MQIKQENSRWGLCWGFNLNATAQKVLVTQQLTSTQSTACPRQQPLAVPQSPADAVPNTPSHISGTLSNLLGELVPLQAHTHSTTDMTLCLGANAHCTSTTDAGLSASISQPLTSKQAASRGWRRMDTGPPAQGVPAAQEKPRRSPSSFFDGLWRGISSNVEAADLHGHTISMAEQGPPTEGNDARLPAPAMAANRNSIHASSTGATAASSEDEHSLSTLAMLLAHMRSQSRKLFSRPSSAHRTSSKGLPRDADYAAAMASTSAADSSLRGLSADDSIATAVDDDSEIPSRVKAHPPTLRSASAPPAALAAPIRSALRAPIVPSRIVRTVSAAMVVQPCSDAAAVHRIANACSPSLSRDGSQGSDQLPDMLFSLTAEDRCKLAPGALDDVNLPAADVQGTFIGYRRGSRRYASQPASASLLAAARPSSELLVSALPPCAHVASSIKLGHGCNSGGSSTSMLLACHVQSCSGLDGMSGRGQVRSAAAQRTRMWLDTPSDLATLADLADCSTGELREDALQLLTSRISDLDVQALAAELQLLGFLGRGAHGVVYEGLHCGSHAAVKFLLSRAPTVPGAASGPRRQPWCGPGLASGTASDSVGASAAAIGGIELVGVAGARTGAPGSAGSTGAAMDANCERSRLHLREIATEAVVTRALKHENLVGTLSWKLARVTAESLRPLGAHPAVADNSHGGCSGAAAGSKQDATRHMVRWSSGGHIPALGSVGPFVPAASGLPALPTTQRTDLRPSGKSDSFSAATTAARRESLQEQPLSAISRSASQLHIVPSAAAVPVQQGLQAGADGLDIENRQTHLSTRVGPSSCTGSALPLPQQAQQGSSSTSQPLPQPQSPWSAGSPGTPLRQPFASGMFAIVNGLHTASAGSGGCTPTRHSQGLLSRSSTQARRGLVAATGGCDDDDTGVDAEELAAATSEWGSSVAAAMAVPPSPPRRALLQAAAVAAAAALAASGGSGGGGGGALSASPSPVSTRRCSQLQPAGAVAALQSVGIQSSAHVMAGPGLAGNNVHGEDVTSALFGHHHTRTSHCQQILDCHPGQRNSLSGCGSVERDGSLRSPSAHLTPSPRYTNSYSGSLYPLNNLPRQSHAHTLLSSHAHEAAAGGLGWVPLSMGGARRQQRATLPKKSVSVGPSSVNEHGRMWQPPPPPMGAAACINRRASTSACDDGSILGGHEVAEAHILRPRVPLPMQQVLLMLSAKPQDYIMQIHMEYCDLGSVAKGVARGLFQLGYAPPGADAALTSPVLVATALDIARGMAYLHANAVIHGDLKASNVLLKSSCERAHGFMAKVADLGVSRVLGRGQAALVPQERHNGTLIYMSPELLTAGSLTKGSDVYAFGVLLFHMTSGRVPYPRLSGAQVMLGVSQGQLTVPWDVVACHSPSLAALGAACTGLDVAARPSFEQIIAVLQSFSQAPADTCDVEPAAAAAHAPYLHGAAGMPSALPSGKDHCNSIAAEKAAVVQVLLDHQGAAAPSLTSAATTQSLSIALTTTLPVVPAADLLVGANDGRAEVQAERSSVIAALGTIMHHTSSSACGGSGTLPTFERTGSVTPNPSNPNWAQIAYSTRSSIGSSSHGRSNQPLHQPLQPMDEVASACGSESGWDHGTLLGDHWFTSGTTHSTGQVSCGRSSVVIRNLQLSEMLPVSHGGTARPSTPGVSQGAMDWASALRTPYTAGGCCSGGAHAVDANPSGSHAGTAACVAAAAGGEGGVTCAAGGHASTGCGNSGSIATLNVSSRCSPAGSALRSTEAADGERSNSVRLSSQQNNRGIDHNTAAPNVSSNGDGHSSKVSILLLKQVLPLSVKPHLSTRSMHMHCSRPPLPVQAMTDVSKGLVKQLPAPPILPKLMSARSLPDVFLGPLKDSGCAQPVYSNRHRMHEPGAVELGSAASIVPAAAPSHQIHYTQQQQQAQQQQPAPLLQRLEMVGEAVRHQSVGSQRDVFYASEPHASRGRYGTTLSLDVNGYDDVASLPSIVAKAESYVRSWGTA